MGAPMAANLVSKGFAVTGFDIVSANLDRATAQGIAAAKTAEQLLTD